MKPLELPVLYSVRRNHALEHASINILNKKYPRKRIIGHSDAGGFWLHTEISVVEVTEAVMEALDRLRDGEAALAYHPGCGTNVAVSGIAAGLGAFIGMWDVSNKTRDKLSRLPLVVTLASIAIIASQPLGVQVQKKISTSPNPGNLEILHITKSRIAKKIAIRVATKG